MGWLMVVFLFGLRTSRTNLHHKKPVLFSAQNIVIFVKSLLIFPPFGGTVSVNSVPKARYKIYFFSLPPSSPVLFPKPTLLRWLSFLVLRSW